MISGSLAWCRCDGHPEVVTNPYALSMAEFDEAVGVPPETRTSTIGQPPESTPLSGDEAATMAWNSGRGVGPDPIIGGPDDGDA